MIGTILKRPKGLGVRHARCPRCVARQVKSDKRGQPRTSWEPRNAQPCVTGKLRVDCPYLIGAVDTARLVDREPLSAVCGVSISRQPAL
jgi:hypothetical protein